jgi:signal transduction histidine kinase
MPMIDRAATTGERALAWRTPALLLALTLGLMGAVGWMGVAQKDPVELIGYLLTAGLVSAALSIGGLLWLRRGRGPLWLQMTVTHALGVGIALLNIYLTARLMFIRESDLPLLVLLLLLAGVASLALGTALAATITSRVRSLHAGARAVASGDLTARVEERGDDEVAGLAREFNRMASQLADAAAERERQEDARRSLIAAVSHDLRTPLASLRAMLEALSDGLVEDQETKARYFTTMRGQIGLLSGLIDDLFELSRIDAGELRLELLRVAPSDLVSDVIEGLRAQAGARGVALEGSVAPGTPAVSASPQRIEQVLANLVTNAIRHTAAGGCVTLRAEPDEPLPPGAGEPAATRHSFVVFAVRDTGEGIAAEDLPHVFERFYRGEKSRSRATGGAGLGLAIAKGIVEAHGGRIWIESPPGAGTTVRFTLPAVEGAAPQPGAIERERSAA